MMHLLVTLFLIGCDIPPRPPLGPLKIEGLDESIAQEEQAEQQQTEELESRVEQLSAPEDLAEQGWETWETCLVGDQVVGYNRYSFLPDEVRGSESQKVSCEIEQTLLLLQGHARCLQRLQSSSKQTAAGDLIQFTSTAQVGPVVNLINGAFPRREDSKRLLKIDMSLGRDKSSREVSWQERTQGFLAVEQSLRKSPLTSDGESRIIRFIRSGFNEIVTLRLSCEGSEEVELLDDTKADLVRVNLDSADQKTDSSAVTYWTNSDGVILRRFDPITKITSFRTDRDRAAELPTPVSETVWLPITGRIDQISKAKRTAFEVSPLQPSRWASMVAADTAVIDAFPSQQTRTAAEHRVQVLVSRDGLKPSKAFRSHDLKATNEDLAKSYLIDHGNRSIKRLTDAILSGRDTSKRQRAIELTRTASTLVSYSAGESTIIPASEVVSVGKADSLGMAIFLTSMLRSQEIPARIALGLRYVAPKTGDPDGSRAESSGNADSLNDESGPDLESLPARMVYHAWAIAYCDDEWIQLDTGNEGLVPADRLLLMTSTFSDQDQSATLVQFLERLTQIKIKALRAQR